MAQRKPPTKSIVISEEALGPAMRALNDRQRAFVVAMYELGADATYAQAARDAGYVGNPNSLQVQAHRLAHSEKVQAAIREEAGRYATGLLPLANKRMHYIMMSPDHPDHLKALKHAQSIAGIGPVQKHEIVHKHDSASLRADLAAALDLLRSIAPSGTMIDVTPVGENGLLTPLVEGEIQDRGALDRG